MKKQVGYLIRRDLKREWIEELERKMGVVYNNHFEYIHPLMSRYSYVSSPKSIRIGWETKEQAIKGLERHLEELRSWEIDPNKKFNYKIVKITTTEESVEDETELTPGIVHLSPMPEKVIDKLIEDAKFAQKQREKQRKKKGK
jgi:hypothetical protein